MLLGIPVPIVAISAGVAHDQYGHDDLLVITMLKAYTIIIITYIYMHSCWIDTDEGAIWGFVAPMLAIITVRFVLFLTDIQYNYIIHVHQLYSYTGQYHVPIIVTSLLVHK